MNKKYYLREFTDKQELIEVYEEIWQRDDIDYYTESKEEIDLLMLENEAINYLIENNIDYSQMDLDDIVCKFTENK